ncbi:PHP domain-containing protein [Tissierella carlieri]|jgi:predicted metal-dependent phosphoesterase TrpH|uniref:PHP domain-containing protein n=1 Tax=Tissierella TaxID=41273 RepID=UPI000BA15943|nr:MULTISPECIES: PHP domain-containing protein [Tissierella]MBU5313576.1 PHP domain-containing protein [Tissierella carlieri]MDU5082822.1 PHP domain-containing protein [Bacillota bacterium]OZV10438.1 histidinol-phosphatase [Tissierella sp. P1]
MIIDTHVHENKYSFDSFLDFKESIELAKFIGLDGICITNHDNNNLRDEIGDSAKINGILVIVGAEVLTHEGDILVFGLKDIPEEMISAEELLKLVKKHNGAAIAAHPFRNNNRGIGENMRKLSHLLDGIESFNGSTYSYHNLQSYALATELNLPSLGASDAHKLEKLGTYATKFYDTIRDHRDFIEALKSGNFHPLMRKNGKYKDIDYFYEDHISSHTKIVSLK